MRQAEHEAAPARATAPVRPQPAERGRPLDASTAGRMGSALGHSFADVRIHDDPAAAAEVGRNDAMATTVGNDISLAPGRRRRSRLPPARRSPACSCRASTAREIVPLLVLDFDPDEGPRTSRAETARHTGQARAGARRECDQRAEVAGWRDADRRATR